MTEFSDWFKSQPFFTRWWLALTVLFSLIGRFRILDPVNLLLLYDPLFRGQIWRPATALFFYPISPSTGFHFLINCYFLFQYSSRLEKNEFTGRPADYFYLLLFNWICCVIAGLYADIMVLMDPMVLSVLYVWCQLNKDVIVNFWFGTSFKAMYLPWVLLLFNLIVSGGGIMELVGIVIGHLYFFLKFKYPQELGGPSLLETPHFFKTFLPDQIGGVYGFGGPPESRAPPPQRQNQGFFGRHNWGQGHMLGGTNNQN